jgi:hypothetical protein
MTIPVMHKYFIDATEEKDLKASYWAKIPPNLL